MKAVILDTGCANLASLAFAVKRLGVEPLITREAADIRSADRIFAHGVEPSLSQVRIPAGQTAF